MDSGDKSGTGRPSSLGGADFVFNGHNGPTSTQDDLTLASMFEALPDAIYLADRQTGLLIDVNPAGERLIQRGRNEIIGMHQSMLHPPQLDETSKRLFAEHAQKLAQGAAAQFEVIRSDGIRVPVEIVGRVISVQGRDALMGVFRDISGRKAIMEELDRRQDTLNQAQRVAHLGVWTWEMATGALEWSDENCRIFGLDPAGPKPTYADFLNALDPSEKPAVLAAIEAAVKGEKAFNMIHKVVRRDGSVRFVHGQAEVIRGANGEPVRMVGTGFDITDRIHIQDQLSENLRIIEAINQAQLSYIAGKDAREVFYHLLETMRHAAECEFGVIMELVHDDGDGGKLLRCLAITEVPMEGEKSLDGPQFTDFNHLICSPVKRGGMVLENGLADEQSFCGISGCCMNIKNYLGLPILKGEEIIGLIGFANREGGFSADLASSLQPVLSTLANIIIGTGIRRQRKKAAMELVKAKETAEEATLLKDQFISIIAHDLRAPFTSILGFMRLLESDLQEKIGDRQMSTIRSVIQGGEHMMEMIDGLLDVSRLKTGKVQVRPRFVDIRQVAAAAAAGVSVMADEKNVRITNLAPEASRVWADPALYGVVIQNLLSNAVKFSKSGDEVAIFVPEESGTTLAVKDAGRGVPEKFASDLFRHEVKTTSPGTGGERGTGLGLPYSADIMKAHGGRIWYESSQDGSVFYTMLPYVRPRALVIDGSPVARAMARAFLEGMDVEVAETASGGEGLDMARTLRPHLVVVDIYTPDVSGLEVIARLKDGKEAGSPAIIAITSDSATIVREQALRAGAWDFTTKPLAANEFVPRVRRFIG